MKILIAGLGSIGRRHLRNLISLGESDVILFRTGKSTKTDDELHSFSSFTQIDQAFAEKPEAVIISNPTSCHMDIAVPAVKAGVNIFLEKPISHNFDSLMPFEAALAGSPSKVFVAYQFRFNPGLQKIKKMLENKEVGAPKSFVCTWGEYLPDWHPWEDYRESYAARSDMGGGVVLTLSHPIDYLLWLFGDVAELSAQTGNRSGLELHCEDFADVQLTYKNGVVGSLHLDYYTNPKQHALLVTCEKATIGWDFQSNAVSVSFNNGQQVEYAPPDTFERNQMYLDEMAHFIDICKNLCAPLCSYEDGKQALNVSLGVLQSGRYNERVIFEDK